MIENLEKLIKEQAEGVIANNSAVPKDKNTEVINAASTSIVDTLKQKLSSGDVSGFANMFKQEGAPDSAAMKDASSSFISKLEGLGINHDSAKNLASSLIPFIIEKFAKKTKDPNDSSFNIQDIVSSISGPNNKFQFSDLSDLLGGGKDEDGKEGGGMMDKLKGLF